MKRGRLAGTAVAFACLASAGTGRAALFGPPTTIPVGASPIRLAVADLNGDGRVDLAVPNRGSDSVSILIGNGSGGFATPTSVPLATAPEAIATGDFDANGSVDLAISTQLGQVHVLLGNGGGGFAEAPGSPFLLGTGTGNTSYGIIAADLNKDGKLDLAATAHDAAYVAVFLGIGNGTFSRAPGSPHTSGAGPMSLVAGDVNGDGKLDLASSAEGTSTVPANNITVLLGTGTGDFTIAPGAPFAANNGPTGLAAGDFNEDGKLDLGCSHEAAANVLVFTGAGDGTFTKQVTLTAGVRAFGVAVADFDADGHLDIATADNGPGQTHVFHGNGAGAFTNAVGSPFVIAPAPAGIVAADLNRDRAIDLVFGNVGSASITILINQTVVPLPEGGVPSGDGGDGGDGPSARDASSSDASGGDGDATAPDASATGSGDGCSAAFGAHHLASAPVATAFTILVVARRRRKNRTRKMANRRCASRVDPR